MLHLLRTLALVSIPTIFITILTSCSSQTKEQVESPQSPGLANEVQANDAPASMTRIEARLLDQAQKSFRAGRYTTPIHNNAYDTFHAVLAINPENSHARGGLQAILLQYAQLVRNAIGQGRLSAASSTLKQAELHYPANALLMDLKRDIATARKALRDQPAMVEKKTPEHEEILLSTHHLDRNTVELQQTFQRLAERLSQSHESILIFARSDREGRWIYKQLKQAANGYRVRGDIRIARSPKVRILPPL